MRQKSIEKLAEDLIQNGFGILEIDENLNTTILEIFAKAQSFFTFHPNEKRASANQALLEGFRDSGTEYSQSPDRPDLCDTFSVWVRNSGCDAIKDWASRNTLHNALTSAIIPFTDLANVVFEILRSQIKQEGQIIQVSDLSYLQVNHYKPTSHIRDFLQDSHEDGHLLTIVKSTRPGLEIMVKGEFQSVTLKDNEVLFMPGSILALMTGGTIPPLFHRVRNDQSTSERLSLMFFVNPSIDQALKPWVENETNIGIDIRSISIQNSAHFGLPSFEEILTKTAY